MAATSIDDTEKRVLFSYKTPVAVFFKDKKELFITEEFFSQTTSKHINKWIKANGWNKDTAYVCSQKGIVEMIGDITVTQIA